MSAGKLIMKFSFSSETHEVASQLEVNVDALDKKLVLLAQGLKIDIRYQPHLGHTPTFPATISYDSPDTHD